MTAPLIVIVSGDRVLGDRVEKLLVLEGYSGWILEHEDAWAEFIANVPHLPTLVVNLVSTIAQSAAFSKVVWADYPHLPMLFLCPHEVTGSRLEFLKGLKGPFSFMMPPAIPADLVRLVKELSPDDPSIGD